MEAYLDVGGAVGQAYPTVSYLMTDPTDNVTRMYPQAILKQYIHQLPGQPEWTTYDISAQFNSDVQWYFEVCFRGNHPHMFLWHHAKAQSLTQVIIYPYVLEQHHDNR